MNVHGVERLIPVNEDHRRPGDVTAIRAKVDAKGQSTEKPLGAPGDVSPRPRIRHMRQLLLVRVLVLTPAVLVVRGDRGVVVAGDARDGEGDEHLDDLVRPRRIADEIAKVVCRTHALARRDVPQHRLERWQIRVNVGDEGVAHRGRRGQLSWSVITVAVAGQASRNSTDCFTSSGTASRCVFTKPKLGKYRSAVVVSR